MSEKFPMTPSGFATMKAQLKKLKDHDRPANSRLQARRQMLPRDRAARGDGFIEALQAEETLSEIDRIIASGARLESIPQIRDSQVMMRLQQELGLRERV